MKRFLCLALAAVLLAAFVLVFLQVQEEEPQIASEPTVSLPANPYSAGDFVWEDGYLTCTAADTVMGIDVSYHQQEIDWQQVKDAGVGFAMIRLGNRGISEGDLRTDPMALANLTGAREAGLRIGAYFYSQATTVTEALEEAALALEILDGMELDLPLAFDWERESRTENVGRRTLTDCTIAFCQAVEDAGYTPMIYFNYHQARDYLYLEELTDYGWWLAMYDAAQEFPWKIDLWQYTNTGSVPGITGNVDINLLFLDHRLGAVFARE